jgi:hypothetical protein
MEHYIVYRRDPFTNRRIVYVATHAELESAGWQRGNRAAGIHDDWVLDLETGEKLEAQCESWHSSDGDDAWVGVEPVASSRRFKIFDDGSVSE